MRTIVNKNNMGAHIQPETIVLQVIEAPHQALIFCHKLTDLCRRTMQYSFQHGHRFLLALPSLFDIIITMMIIISTIIIKRMIIIIKIIGNMTIIIMITITVIVLIPMIIIMM